MSYVEIVFDTRESLMCMFFYKCSAYFRLFKVNSRLYPLTALTQVFLLQLSNHLLLSVVTNVDQLLEYDSKTSDIVSFLFWFVR